METNLNNQSQDFTLTIDNQVCKAKEGDTILDVARRNGIYIPTMCYLTKVLPIASCRMCVVEVEGVEGLVLSCQEKAIKDTVVFTQTETLQRQRENIVKLYNVNHPLECGVCDKSGECELQNKNLEFGIHSQEFSTTDVKREVQQWGPVSYDEALCIMCEKCVAVSNEITGDEALGVEYGGYGSRIINKKPDTNPKTLLEAAAVCPVGALVDSKFKYSANAWELERGSTTCMHCSAGCMVDYELKPDSISNRAKRVYRIGNDTEFATLCPTVRGEAGRILKPLENEPEAGEAFLQLEKADSIAIGGAITNEEAYAINRYAKENQKKLYSPEVYGYQQFLEAFTKSASETLYSGDVNSIKEADFIMTLGLDIANENPQIAYAINQSSKINRAIVAQCYTHFSHAVQNNVTHFLKYEPGSEEYVAALLLSFISKEKAIETQTIVDFIDELDIGQLSAESNISEEEIEELMRLRRKRNKSVLLVGEALYGHPRAKQIAILLGLFQRHLGWNVVLVPPTANALGIALLCDLEASNDELADFGYEANGKYVIGYDKTKNRPQRSFYQKSGSVVNSDKRVVPLYPIIENQQVGLFEILKIGRFEYAKQGAVAGLIAQNSAFELLDRSMWGYDNCGNERRGYRLSSQKIDETFVLEEPEEFEPFDGTVLYFGKNNERLSWFGDTETPTVKGSKQFALAAKIEDGQRIEIEFDGEKLIRLFKIDTSMRGTIALSHLYDKGLSEALLSSYRYKRVAIKPIKEGQEEL